MTPDECHEFKREILREIELHKISIYQFPDGADEEENKLNKKLKERIPFAVIGSNAVLVRFSLEKLKKCENLFRKFNQFCDTEKCSELQSSLDQG